MSEVQLKRFIVGVDGSDAGAAALRWTAQLAVRVGAEVLVVNAYQHPYAKVTRADRESRFDERSALLADEWVRPARDAGISVTTEVRLGDPRDVLATADDSEADLVVLGRTGQGGGPGFLHLGSVVEYIAHHTRVPLAVIPPYVSETVDRVVVGVDGSAESSAAVIWCADLVGSMDAEVVAVTVEAPYPEWVSSSVVEGSSRDLEQLIEEWVAPISETGVTVTPVVGRDLHPADGLIGVASARRGDLLIVGTRGAGGFSGLRLGGVAMKVLHRAAIPMVLVPPAS